MGSLWVSVQANAQEAPPSDASILEWIATVALPPGTPDTARMSSLLEAGQSDRVTEALLHALAGAQRTEVRDVLLSYSQHRRAAVRGLAYASLAAPTGSDPDVDSWLARGLSDLAPRVRTQCAEALGRREARTQWPQLLQAFERGVAAAAEPVGRLAPPSALARIHALAGRAPLSQVLASYGAWLRRSDLPADAKLEILHRIEELASPAVGTWLSSLLSAKAFTEARVRRAAQALQGRLGEAPASRRPRSSNPSKGPAP